MVGPFGSGANAHRRSERAVGTESTSWKRRSQVLRSGLSESRAKEQATGGLVRPLPEAPLTLHTFRLLCTS